MKPLSARTLTTYYVSALLIVATLSTLSHVILGAALKTQEGTASTINISGRQRMLSQRIASMAAQWKLGDESARQEMLAATDQFEAAHLRLIQGNESDDGVNLTNLALHQLYFEGGKPLDTEVKTFIGNVRKLAQESPASPAAALLLTQIFSEARFTLVSSLDEVVSIHQRESERRLSLLKRLQWLILSVVLITLLIEGTAIFRPMVQRIIAYTAELLRLATTDVLTATANRRHFMERAQEEWARAKRYERPLTLLMLDADHFKNINDAHGHAAGDEVLKLLCLEVRKALRPTDLIGRMGGEEFAILLPETAVSNAIITANRLTSIIENTSFTHEKKTLKFTVSIGVSAVPLHPGGIDEALKIADRFLFEAKSRGRNCVMPELSV